MPKLPMTFACGLYDRMLALYTGEAQPEGIDLNFLAIDSPREIFDRMGKNLEFDACEMSSSEVISRHAAGRRELVALPVFPSRVFRHGFITVNRKAVRTPKDLEGKRIGVPLYTQTAAVFIRGMLADEYGVDLSGVHSVQGATDSPEPHGNPSPPPLLKPVSIEQNRSGFSLSDLLAQRRDPGHPGGAGCRLRCARHSDVVRLFPDFHKVELNSYRRTRISRSCISSPCAAMSTSGIRSSPPASIDAMDKAKNIALAEDARGRCAALHAARMTAELEEIDEVFGGDPWPYGIEPNRPTLEALVRYMAEQSLIKATIPLEELFVPSMGSPHAAMARSRMAECGVTSCPRPGGPGFRNRASSRAIAPSRATTPKPRLRGHLQAGIASEIRVNF